MSQKWSPHVLDTLKTTQNSSHIACTRRPPKPRRKCRSWRWS